MNATRVECTRGKLKWLCRGHCSLVPRPSRGGNGKAWYALCAHARNYCEIYVREQWACTQNVIINYCTRVFEIRKVYTVVHRSSGDRKEERH